MVKYIGEYYCRLVEMYADVCMYADLLARPLLQLTRVSSIFLFSRRN